MQPNFDRLFSFYDYVLFSLFTLKVTGTNKEEFAFSNDAQFYSMIKLFVKMKAEYF